MNSRNEKEKYALFVDLTNFYTRFIKSNLGTEENLVLILLIGLILVFFHQCSLMKYQMFGFSIQAKNLVPKGAKITNQYMNQLISRINQQKGVTAYNVNISGEQREPFKSKCENCGNETDTIWKSEKGIDSSLIVHLFDTMESWNVAYLLSGDADFVPAVKSLRRRGKIVNGAGFTANASSALIRECFDYINLEDFFSLDLAIYNLFRKEGLISKFFTESIPKNSLMDKYNSGILEEIRLSISLNYKLDSSNVLLSLGAPVELNVCNWEREAYQLPLMWTGYQQTITGTFQTTFSFYLFDYLKNKLKLIAQRLQLDKGASTNFYENEYQYYEASFVWNKTSEVYERYKEEIE